MGTKQILILLVAGLSFVVGGCETHEDNSIAAAQSCLDVADVGTAAKCRQQVAGIQTPTAYLIRCSADFIMQGFDSSALTAAYSQLSSATGNSTTAMLGFLVFSSAGATNQSSADQAQSDCAKSQVPSMALLGSFAQTATLIASMCTSSCSFDTSSGRTASFPASGFADGIAQLYTASQPASGSPAAQKNAIIGNAVLVAYNQQCSDAVNANSDICSQIVQATKGSLDPETVGYDLIALLHNNP